MKTLAFTLALVALAVVQPLAAQHAVRPKPSAACNPWSANYWGDVVIRSQADADELACFRRVVGSLTVIETDAPIVLSKLHGIVGNLRIVFPGRQERAASRDSGQLLSTMLPVLSEVTGDVELELPAFQSRVREALGIGRMIVRGEVRVAICAPGQVCASAGNLNGVSGVAYGPRTNK